MYVVACFLNLLFMLGLTSASSIPRSFRVSIKEELPVGTFVINLWPHANRNTLEVDFKVFSTSGVENFFILDARTGDVHIRKRIDRESLCQMTTSCCASQKEAAASLCLLTLMVRSDAEYKYVFTLTIQVDDVNDHSPVWSMTQITKELSENSALHTFCTLPLAIDLDTESFSVQRYELLGNAGISDFELLYDKFGDDVPNHELRLIVRSPLDRERIASYSFSVVAYDGGNPPRTGLLKLNIHILDENDNAPVFVNNHYSVRMHENIRINSELLRVQASDADSGLNAKIRYSISSFTKSKWQGLFMIEAHTGIIRVQENIDFERHSYIELIVQAEDQHVTAPKRATTEVKIYVIDENDNSPHFNLDGLRGKVEENLAAGRAVAIIEVGDADDGENGEFTCKQTTFVKQFQLKLIGAGIFKLQTIAVLDREASSFMSVTVECADHGQPSLTSSAVITVEIVDENDNAPKFDNTIYYKHVNEAASRGDFLFTVNATDLDWGNNSLLHYSIHSNESAKYFTIDWRSGNVFLAQLLDREMLERVQFVIVAADHGQPQLQGSSTVVVIVQDDNDNHPLVATNLNFSVMENQTVGSLIGQLNVTDLDKGDNGKIHFLIDSLSTQTKLPFNIDKDGQLLLSSPLDREKESEYVFQVIIRDSGIKPLTGATLVHISVIDVNDCTPMFDFEHGQNRSLMVSVNAKLHQEIGRINAQDCDTNENGRVYYTIKQNELIPFLHLHRDSGFFTLVHILTQSDIKEYQLIVLATDGGYPQRSQQTIITVRVVENNLRLSVNDNIDLKRAFGSKIILSENLLIMLSLVTITVIFVFVFAVAVIIFSYRKWRRQVPNDSTDKQICEIQTDFSSCEKQLMMQGKTDLDEAIQSKRYQDCKKLQRRSVQFLDKISSEFYNPTLPPRSSSSCNKLNNYNNNLNDGGLSASNNKSVSNDQNSHCQRHSNQQQCDEILLRRKSLILGTREMEKCHDTALKLSDVYTTNPSLQNQLEERLTKSLVLSILEMHQEHKNKQPEDRYNTLMFPLTDSTQIKCKPSMRISLV